MLIDKRENVLMHAQEPGATSRRQCTSRVQTRFDKCDFESVYRLESEPVSLTSLVSRVRMYSPLFAAPRRVSTAVNDDRRSRFVLLSLLN